jgi:hypothetical protein
MRRPTCCFILFIAFSFSCLGQDGSTGAIRGTVFDPSGNRIAGATVALVHDANGVHYERASDSRGQFAFELLPPGDYSARVAGEGMSPQLSPGIHVSVGGASEITFKLALAGARESVTVSAEPHSVETQPRGLSTVLDERAIQNLPLNGRPYRPFLAHARRHTGSPRAEL